MGVERVRDEWGTRLRTFATRIYEARREFLRAHFDGYVEDTYYVVDSGYYCWPAQRAGAFDGYTDLVEAERAVVDDVEDAGLDVLGVGLGRVACSLPETDLVVKFGRCGMGDEYGAGRYHNLLERQISRATDLPVLPCRYCSPRGEFAIYPEAELADGDDAAARRASQTLADELGASDRFDDFDVAEATRPANLGQWRGEWYTLDYCKSDDIPFPYGVPDHVDGRAVVERVDELRERGEKRDMRVGGGWAD